MLTFKDERRYIVFDLLKHVSYVRIVLKLLLATVLVALEM